MVRKVTDKVTGDDRQGQGGQGYGQGYDRQPQGYDQGQQSYGQGAPRQQNPGQARDGRSGAGLSPADRQALAKYDYLLQTAPPQQLEQVHRDAFERLTPAQREQVLARLTAESPAGDRPASSSPADLARSATRGEVARPGLMKRVLGSSGGKVAAGAGVAALGGLALAVAGGAALSAVAAPLLTDALASGVDFEQFTGGFEGLEGLGGFEGVDGLAASGEDLAASGGDFVGGLGEQASEFGSNFQIPGLSDFFDR